MKYAIPILILSLSGSLAVPAVLEAQRTGVGVTTGRIEVHEPLKPGQIYPLPPVGVRNTGDGPGQYTATITFHADQEELRPEAEWFHFSPAPLYLEAGALGSIQPVLSVPVRTAPGDYFAYIEVSPVREAGRGTTVGIAAATRLHFTVEPANVLQAMYYRALHFWNAYAPWAQVVSAMLAATLVVVVARRFFDFNIGVRKKNNHA